MRYKCGYCLTERPLNEMPVFEVNWGENIIRRRCCESCANKLVSKIGEEARLLRKLATVPDHAFEEPS